VNSEPLRGESNCPGDATITELTAAIEREAEKRPEVVPRMTQPRVGALHLAIVGYSQLCCRDGP